MTENRFCKVHKENGLAMDEADLGMCRDYFRDEEERDPTITEIKMIDTYWSDHCRHTTFGTIIDSVNLRMNCCRRHITIISRQERLGRTKPVCLMDIATIAVNISRSTEDSTNSMSPRR